MEVDMWLLLPPDLLLEIFCRMEFTAVVRCTAACKPWRRAIIGNASCLQPRHDGFVPSLLVGILYINLDGKLRLRPLESSLAVQPSVNCDGGGGVDLCVQQGVVIARRAPPARGQHGGRSLPVEHHGRQRRLHIPARRCGQEDATATRIVAVEDDGGPFPLFSSRCLTYQLFFSASGGSGGGAWGPIKRCPEHIFPCTGGVICRGAIHWLGDFEVRGGGGGGARHNCTVAVDVRTGAPGGNAVAHRHKLVNQDGPGNIQGWASVRGQRAAAAVPPDPGMGARRRYWSASFYTFCPRSGYVVGNMYGRTERRRLLMDVDSGTAREMNMWTRHGATWPYEMDLSNYISKMKHF
ncbi:hypothetical protein ACP4OV_002352 [Aristida adscensionis]